MIGGDLPSWVVDPLPLCVATISTNPSASGTIFFSNSTTMNGTSGRGNAHSLPCTESADVMVGDLPCTESVDVMQLNNRNVGVRSWQPVCGGNRATEGQIGVVNSIKSGAEPYPTTKSNQFQLLHDKMELQPSNNKTEMTSSDSLASPSQLVDPEPCTPHPNTVEETRLQVNKKLPLVRPKASIL